MIFLVHCQSVTAEKLTIDAVVGNSTKFQWLVDRNGSSLLSLLIVHGTEFSRSRILFTMAGDKFTPALLATNDFKGRLNATISGDLEKDPKFFCTLTLNDLQLTDENESFLLHVTFSDGVIKQNVVTLREVRGIYCFFPLLLALLFFHESHDVEPFKQYHQFKSGKNFELLPFLCIHMHFMHFIPNYVYFGSPADPPTTTSSAFCIDIIHLSKELFSKI